MVKKKEQENIESFKCDNCAFFTDKCEHSSNLRVFLKRRIEITTYKSLEKKKECGFYKCLEN